MSSVLLDAGALIAVEGDDRQILAMLRVARSSGVDLRTTGVVLAQVWRHASGRQAKLARFLRAVDIRPVDALLGRRGGELLGRTGMADAVDATLVAAAERGDRILTSDPDDIGPLVAACDRPVRVVAC